MRGRGQAWATGLAFSTLVLLLLVVPSTETQAAPVLGGQLFSTGTPVEIEVLPASAALTSTLYLLEPEEVRIATNRDVGTHVTVGPYASGEELIFGIRVSGREYRMGPAQRNPDGVIHATVDFLDNGCAIVGFEDLFGGGDRDYNDNRFQFCGGIAPEPPPEPPPPPPPVFVPPTADAGDDQTVPEGSVVTLDGTRSRSSGLRTKTYTTTADFTAGERINVTTSTPDQLQLDNATRAFNFIWIAASARGTVVKVDTLTGEVLGEYWSAPQNRAKDPSRTTVDKSGNVWVGNRAEESAVGGVAKGSVTQIGLSENGQCVDRNGNGTIDTSTGLGDIRPWPNTSGADTDGGVDTAADECVVHYMRTDGIAIRQVSVDAENHVWVGGPNGTGTPRFFDRISPDGQIVRSINMASPAQTGESAAVRCCYGGLVDPNGILWSSTSDANQLVRIDPSKPNGDAGLVRVTALGRFSYGLGIDPAGFLWQTNWTSNSVQKISPAGALVGTFSTGGPSGDRGVASTADGDIWVANSSGSSVSRLRNNGSFVTQVAVGQTPTGVAVDGAGKVWSANLTSSTASRINPATNAVDLTVSLGSGAGPYNYSDMTGSTLTGAPDEGTWSVVYDSGAAGTEWAFVDWTGNTPGDAELTVSVAGSNDGTSFGPDVEVDAREEITGVDPSRYLRITVHFTRSSGGETPELLDLTVAHAGDQAAALAYKWRLSELNGPPIFLSSTTAAKPSFVAPDDGTYTFELTVTDAAGGSDTDEVTVRVENVAPELHVESTQGVAGSLTLVSGSHTDAGWLDTHAGTIDWGDGTATDLHVTDGTGWGTAFGSHRYTTPGAYQVSLVLTDDDGGRSTAATATAQISEGVALWANSSTASSTIDWTGGSNTISGRIHSNRDVRITSSHNRVTGSFEYVNSFNNGGSDNVYVPPPVRSTVQSYPVSFTLADYQPGGRAAIAAGSQYYDLTAECRAKGKIAWTVAGTALATGLYYAPCNVALTASSLVGTFTFVSTGTVSVTGSKESLAAPFIDGLLLFTNSTSTDAIKVSGSNSGFSGFVYAPKGRVALTSSNSRYFCGLLGDRITITGSSNTITGGGCAQPADDTAGTLLVPTIGLDLTADRTEALPSQDIAYDLTVSNDGSSLIVSGLVGAENVDTRSWPITAFRWALETYDVQTRTWRPLATVDPAGNQGATLSVLPNTAPGVTYGPGAFVDTSLEPGSFASWSYEAVVPLDPARVRALLDPAVTGGIRVRFDLNFGDPAARVRQLFRFGNDFIQELRALSGDVTDANVMLLLPTGDPVLAGPAEVPALARLTPGDSVDLGRTYTVGAPAARRDGETDAGYVSRLRVLDGTGLVGSSFALAQGGVGRLVAPLVSTTTTERLPVLGLSTVGPESIVAGAGEQYEFRLANLGSAGADGIGLSADAAGAPLALTGAPSTLVPGGLATATTTYTAPALNPPADVTVTGSVSWSDEAGNVYGPVRSATKTPILTPGTLVATLSDAVAVDVAGDGNVSPGDTVRYTLIVRNVGGVAVHNAVATVTPDPNSALVVGSVTAAGGTVVQGNGAGDTSVRIAWASVAGDGSVQATFDVRVADPFPATTTRLQVQGQIAADGIDQLLTDDPALPGAADPTRTLVVVPSPNLTAFLSGRLAIDPDGNGGASAGDTLRYSLVVTSVGAVPVTGIRVAVPIPAGTSLVPGSVTTTAGTVGAGSGVSVDVGTLAMLAVATIGFDLRIDDPEAAGITQISAQGTVSSNELADLYTDDPETFTVGDPTVIPIHAPGSGGGGGGGGGGGSEPPAPPGPAVGAVSPAEGTILTEPATVSATLTPAAGTTVTGWTVSYRFADDATLTQLAAGTGTDVSATIDPTAMPNGSYVLVIRATSSDGGVTVSERSFVVDGQLKLGRYTTAYEDLDVGVAGFPVRVIRHYDSFDKTLGDFGIGWRVEIANFRISTNGPLGDGGWRMFSCGPGLIFVPLCFESSRPHYVTVTWPNGLNEIFDLTPARGSTFLSGLTAAQFTGRAGTTSKLEAFDSSLYYSNGNMLGGFFGTEGIYDPTRFRLTDRFGTAYVLDVDRGLLELSDRNGNRVTFGPNGIASTFGPAVTFTRDSLGRITQIKGPDDETVGYGYDANGDLVSVTDQNENVTHFTYKPGHYLESVLDPLNRPSTRLEYGPDGRLAAVIDGEGNRIAISTDVGARTQTVTDPEQRKTTISTFDDRGNVILRDEVFDGASHRTEYQYDDLDNLVFRKDPLGNVWEAKYDGRDLVRYEDPEDDVVEITYDEFGEPRFWKDQDGKVTEYRWNPDGTLKEIVDANLNAESYTYFPDGLRETRTDREGKVWRWTYYPSGLVKTETDPRNNTTTFEYDEAGRLTKTIDDLGGETTREYDDVGNLRFETDADGNRTEWRYDQLNNVLQVIDADGHAVTYTHDAAGRLRSVDNEEDLPTTYEYDRDGHRVSEQVGDLDPTVYAYDGGGRLASVTDPVGRETSYTYYANGWPHTEENAAGGVTERFYFPDGSLQRIEDPYDHATSFTYDPVGRLASATDPVGRTTRYEYDPVGRLVKTTHHDATFTESAYDKVGRLVRSWDEERDETQYEYDGAGNRTAVVDPEQRRVEYGFDDLNRLERQTDADGVETRFTYSRAGRLTKIATRLGVTTELGYNGRGLETSRRDSLGNTWTSTYDGAGRLDVERDARGATLDYDYDDDGRLASITDVAGHRVSFGYDDAGQRVSVTDPRSKTWEYTYDELGGLETVTDPLDHVRSLSYDLAGKLESRTDGRGVIVDYTYFPDDSVKTVGQRGGTESIAYGYDELGRRESMTDETGTTTWGYTPSGRIESIAAPAGTVSYDYDRSGRRTLLTHGSRQIGYAYDPAGRLDSMTLSPGSPPIEFGYEGDGRLKTVSRPNGVTTTYTYDAAGRLDRIDHAKASGPVEFYDYTLDANGDRTSVASTAGTESYTINALRQLERVVYPGGRQVDYTYDAAGNRLTEHTSGSATVNYAYDDASRLTSVAGIPYTHDDDGNLTSDGSTAYVWDWLGRLASVGSGPSATSYRYDGDGIRVRATTGGSSTDLLYDRPAAGGLPQLLADGTRTYVDGPGGLLAQIGAATAYAHTDALGSVRAFTDSAGATAGRASFDVFGGISSRNGTTSRLGFTGAQQDVGLVHLNARDLSTSSGRFLTVDPVRPGAPGVTGWNPYAYAGNNPTGWTDPTGAQALTEEAIEYDVVAAAEAIVAAEYRRILIGRILLVAAALGGCTVSAVLDVGPCAFPNPDGADPLPQLPPETAPQPLPVDVPNPAPPTTARPEDSECVRNASAAAASLPAYAWGIFASLPRSDRTRPRNVATSAYCINEALGIVGAVSGEQNRPGLVPTPTDPAFPPWGGFGSQLHAEWKIVNQLWAVHGPARTPSVAYIYSLIRICGSCANVINEYEQRSRVPVIAWDGGLDATRLRELGSQLP